ncbi:MAG: hypothetical protein AAF542_23645 [Pseudomonadota bacterium]
MTRTQQGLLMLSIGVFLAITAAYVGLVNAEDGAKGYEVALRWTGRLAFFAFLIPFIASPLRTLVKSELSAALVRMRRSAGIAYGGMQSVHLLIIAATIKASETNPFDMPTLIVGGAGLGLAIVMMLTSFDVPAKMLGPKAWKMVHNSGFYVFAFVYFFDFLVKPFEVGLPPVYWPFMVLTLGAFILRFAAFMKRRREANENLAAI